jgi:hypothetical protein
MPLAWSGPDTTPKMKEGFYWRSHQLAESALTESSSTSMGDGSTFVASPTELFVLAATGTFTRSGIS